MPTPHISAPDGAFAPSVLMPGDPRRAARIAENFLTGTELVTDVRGMNGFTGIWKGTPVSVMPSGMGMPSAAIYITELARFYGVQRILRVGTCGVYAPDLGLRQVVIGSDAVTNSVIPSVIGAPDELHATDALVETAQSVAAVKGVAVETGTIFSSDVFYEPDDDTRIAHTEAGVLVVEMEAAALYALSATERFDALTLVTTTDHLVTGEHLSPEERQQGVDKMIELALDIVAEIA